MRAAILDNIETKKWNIKSVDFAGQLGLTISRYITEGEEKSLKDFILFKTMTYSGHPIYGAE